MEDAPAPGAPARPTAWFLHGAARTWGPLEREELRGYFAAGVVGADDTVSGPDWDGRLPAAEVAARLGWERRAAGARAAAPPPMRRDVVYYTHTDAAWFAPTAWAAILFAVQAWLVQPRPAGAGPWLGAAAWGFVQVGVPCVLLAGGLWWLLRGHRPGARVPLAAMSAVYAVLLGRALLAPATGPPAAPVAVADAAVDAPAATTPEAIVEDAPGWSDELAPDADAATSETDAEADATAPVDAAPVPAPALASPAAAPTAAVPVARDEWQSRAKALFDARDWAGLRALALAWTQAEPDRVLAWQVLGVAERHGGSVADAIAAFERAVALGSHDPNLLRSLADAYYDSGDRPGAIAASRRLLADDPDNAFALGVYGRAQVDLGELDEGIDALEHATRVAPREPYYWRALAAAYRRGGYVDKARDALAKANALR